MIGTIVSHYRILEKLGEGVSGVTYKARDTRLNRHVAVKILVAQKLADPARTQRLVEEAKAASMLNHPNIVAIYDIDHDQGVDFVAMEYVAGHSLEELIPRKGLRLSEALRYAVQIANAVTAAHAAGVIHRDLKPGNVMVTESRLVKVLDFGLGALTEPEGVAAGRESSQTMTADGDLSTEESAIPELSPYASPEQVNGRAADARSDIFSLGALVYEMISGRRAFEGGSETSTAGAILRQNPRRLGDIAGAVPHELEKLVARCLRNEPRQRFQAMGDVALILEELLEECDSGRSIIPAARATPPAGPWTSPKVLISFLVLLGAVSALTWWWTRATQPNQGATFMSRLTRLTKDAGLAITPAMSPGGKLIAYASDRAGKGDLDIWVQQVSTGGAIRLTQDAAAEYSPAFSPDGSQIVYRSDQAGGGIYVIPALGGHARLVVSGGQRPKFSPDGNMIAYYAGPQSSFSGTRIYVVPSQRGEPRRLASDFRAAASPIWTPDGKHLLFVGIHPTEGWDWWVTAIDGGPPVATRASEIFQRQGLTAGPPGPDAWVQGNHVIFTAAQGDSTNLWRVRISPRTWRVEGPAQRVTFGAGELQAGVGPGGRVVFTSGSDNIDIWSLPSDPNQGAVVGELQRLTTSAAADFSCDVSANGKTLVFRSDRSDNIDVWGKDLETGTERVLATSQEFKSLPKVTADGAKVAFGVRTGISASGNSKWIINAVPSQGGLSERVCEECGPPMCWTSDGKKLVYVSTGTAQSVLYLLDTETGHQRLLAKHPDLPVINAARLSSDDRWLALKGDLDMHRSVIFVVPLREWSALPAQHWIAITEGQSWDDVPRWSPDGTVVYFTSDRDGFRCIWARRLERQTKKPVGPPFAVRHFHRSRFSLVGNLALIELAVARDKLVFPLQELTGSIWMMHLGESNEAR